MTMTPAHHKRVAVVNQTFVRVLLHGANPIGQTLRTHPEPGYPSTIYEIVGVIPDTKYEAFGPTRRRWPLRRSHSSPTRNRSPQCSFVSNLPPAVAINSLKRRIAEGHPEIVAQFRVFQKQIRDGFVRERLMALLSAFFALLAALLGIIGLYGVMSYTVSRRGNEIGIRIALGANRSQVLGMVMREAGMLLLIGIVIGTALALAAARAAESLLFGLKPHDLSRCSQPPG